MSRNPITDLRPLANLAQLVELHFWHFPANPTNLDLRPLANLINLEKLTLTGNGITDITPLAGLKKLRELHIANNHIEDFSLLAELTNLKKLWIQRNWTRDISPLLSLNLIEFLYDEVCDFIPLRDSVESRIIVDFGINYTLLPYQSSVRSRAILRRTRPNAKCIIARLFKTCANNYGDPL